MRRTLIIVISLLSGIGLSACAVPYSGPGGYYDRPYYSYEPVAPWYGYGYYPFNSFSLYYSDVRHSHRQHNLSGGYHRYHRGVEKRHQTIWSDRAGTGYRNQRFERGDRSNRGKQFRAQRRSGRSGHDGTATRFNRFSCSGPRC